MDIFSLAGLIAVGKIIIIDILLAGDNAIVIGMAAANLPLHHRKKAIWWGTAGAILIRLLLAVFFLEALERIPLLHIVGGILLLWIGYKLMVEQNQGHQIEAKSNLWDAVRTIVIADGIMGIDNVLGVVAAANGDMFLVFAGMLVTVPIIIWGSTFFINLIERFPIILYGGGGILGWVGASMISNEKYFGIKELLEPYHYPFGIACAVIILLAAWITNKVNRNKEKPVVK